LEEHVFPVVICSLSLKQGSNVAIANPKAAVKVSFFPTF